MQDFISLLSMNTDALTLSVAGGIATLLIFVIKSFFSAARRLAQKTTTVIDDKIVDETEKSLKEKSGDI